MESDEEFHFRSAEKAEEENRDRNRKRETKIARQVGHTTKKGGKVKVKMWLDVVKGLKTEHELEIANSSGNRRESEMFDSDITNQVRAKLRKRQ